MSILFIDVYVDGEEPEFLPSIQSEWLNVWNLFYSSIGQIVFRPSKNVKDGSVYSSLPDRLKAAFQIRNPDLFFVAELDGASFPIGGIEITAHSPDGSNVEKRYPFIWSGRRYGFNAFVVSPYMKRRPGGALNRLPNRHSARNLDLLSEWRTGSSLSNSIQQIVPIRELQDDYNEVVRFLGCDLLSITDLAAHFVDVLAQERGNKIASLRIASFTDKLAVLANSCLKVTRYTEASSAIQVGSRMIQIYNTRPDSGHWERGEGQFDSIDGRLMFTLDEAELKTVKTSLEFWMPQLSRQHAWIAEQRARDHGSKRLRNIMVVLSNELTVKFADDLTVDDIAILVANPSLTLERQDWRSGIYSLSELLRGNSAEWVARLGLKNPSIETVKALTAVLTTPHLFMSAHRLYEQDWLSDLQSGVQGLPAESTVIVPRIPSTQIPSSISFGSTNMIFAEACTKHQLMALRQLHRIKG